MGAIRLSASAPVSMRRTACLRTRLHRAACRDCADACPVHALTVGPEGIALTGSRCTGCGRCQAACPMGAVSVDGFEGLAVEVEPSRPDLLVVDCMRQDRSSGPGAAEIRVPCLGGLSEGALLALCARVPQRAVIIADHGQCGSCDSGGPTPPAVATLHAVAGLMREAGVPHERLPRLQAADAATSRSRGPAGDDPLQSRGRSRRGFFTALARPAAGASAPLSPAFTVPSAERRSIVAALESLARRHGGRVPASLFHRVSVHPDCEGHRVCASACPTGALVRYRDDVSRCMGIAFDSTACIGCGHCAAVCPGQALELHHGGGSTQAGHRPLTRFVQRECADCGARFATTAGDRTTHCERCRKSAQLARSAFATLFPARP